MTCFILVFAMTVCAAGQANQTVIQPPALHGLVPVNLPDTRYMETEVREHVNETRSALDAAVKEPSAPAGKLAEAYGSAGQIFHAYSLISSAMECYQNALRLAPGDFRWAYLLGKLREREGEAAAAIGNYEAARKLRPDYLPVYVSLGNVYLQLNRLAEAEGLFKMALDSAGTSAAAQYGLGQAALSRRDYAEAARYLEGALRLAPEANRLRYALGMAYRGLGETEKARAQLELSGPVGVRATDPLVDRLQELARGARLHLIRGRAALEARRYEDAAAEFRKAIAGQPDSVPAHFNLGAALSQTGDLRGAVEQFQETLRLDPGHANAHYNLGLLFSQMKMSEQAVGHLRSAVALQPNDNSARSLLARLLLESGRPEEADAELAKVVDSDPENEEALLERVKVLTALNRHARAIEALEKGLARSPQKGRTAAALAYLLATSPQPDLRDGKRALALAQSAYEATGAAAHGALVAAALAELGRCDDAADWARRMAEKATAEGRPELASKLKGELNRYEKERPCRQPAGVSQAGRAPGQ